MPSAFAGALSGSVLTAGGVELRQLNPAVAVRRPHHGEVGTNVVEPFEVVARGIDAISITMRACPPGVLGLARDLGALGPADVTPHAIEINSVRSCRLGS
jgi:hypothetical protein